MLRLSPLPAPPDEPKTQVSRSSESASDEQVENPQAEQLAEQTREVNQTSSADKATLRFANIRQPNQDMVAIDFSGISKDLGIEVPGFLGFSTFRILETKIDSRDGLGQFIYDPNKLPPALRAP
jgi:hypothetical protein